MLYGFKKQIKANNIKTDEKNGEKAKVQQLLQMSNKNTTIVNVSYRNS